MRHKNHEGGVKFSHLKHYHEYRLNSKRTLLSNELGQEELHGVDDESWDMTEEEDNDNTDEDACMVDLILG